MDPEDLRMVLRDSGADLWALIDGAIEMAARDHGDELRARRDGIVERLYGAMLERCRNCEAGDVRFDSRGEEGEEEEREEVEEVMVEDEEEAEKGNSSPATPQSMNKDDEEEDDEGEEADRSSVDDQKTKILAIKDFLDDQDQPDESLVGLLQNLADMDVTVHVLQETDIGRHVNHLRKHSSPEVRQLVKLLVRKWKETVDEYVNTTNGNASDILGGGGDSLMQANGRSSDNGNRVPEFGSSPDPNNAKNFAAKRQSPMPPSNTLSSTTSNKAREAKDLLEDPEKLASATRRLQQNYQEASNAKKQRTIQMVEIHDIPKPNTTFVPRGRGGGGGGRGGGGGGRGGFNQQRKRW